MESNLQNIETALRGAGGKMLDLGCGDGSRTMRFAAAAEMSSVHGVEVTRKHVRAAERRGIEVTVADLNRILPFPDKSFDIVISNQVIEHLSDTDQFVSECRRLLRPGGLCVCSTENLASWHNVFALLFGWQPFSLTNVSSTRLGIGNPAAIHRDEESGLKSWEHLRVFAHRGLRELHEAHGFRNVRVLGAGYYPLSANIGRLDPRHAAFLTVVANAG